MSATQPDPPWPHTHRQTADTLTTSRAHIYGKALRGPGGPWKEELTEDTGEGAKEEGPGRQHANPYTGFASPAGLAEAKEYLGGAVSGAPDGGRTK